MRPAVFTALREMYARYEQLVMPFAAHQMVDAAWVRAVEAAAERAASVLDDDMRKLARALPEAERLEVMAYVKEQLDATTHKMHQQAARPGLPAGQATVDAYHRCLTALHEAARQEPDTLRALDGDTSAENQEKGLRVVRAMWAQLRNARVFDFEPETYRLAYLEADHYICKLANIPWEPWDPAAPPPPQEEVQRLTEVVNERSRSIPFPDPLPFETMFIGFGRGIGVDPHQLDGRMVSGPARARVIGAAVIGMLVHAADQRVVELVHIVEQDGDDYIMPNMTCENGCWIMPMVTLHPWLVTHLVSIINEHRQLVIEKKPGFRERLDARKLGKKLSIPTMIPQPYYIVRLHKQLIVNTGKKMQRRLSQIRRELTYRYDRRGHERCYIQRGKLPLKEKDRKKLEQAQYKIWTIEQPDATAYRQLLERGQPSKDADEWLAILTRWIDPTVCGPDGLPYIPALRMPAVQAG